MTGCPFCERIAAADHDPALSVPGLIAVFEPLNPVTQGHLLVVPLRHVEHAAAAPALAASVMGHAAHLTSRLGIQANIITSIGPDATQTVLHLHVHLIPRRPGDGLALPWTGQAAR